MLPSVLTSCSLEGGGAGVDVHRPRAFLPQIAGLTCPAETEVLCYNSHLHICPVCPTEKTWGEAMEFIQWPGWDTESTGVSE